MLSQVEDPLKGWFGDLSISDEAFEQTLKLHWNEVRNCVIVRNAVICIGYLLMDKHIINNTLEEVKADFEASLFLATHGFYKYSMVALRSALEVGFYGLFCHYNPKCYEKWYKGTKRTEILEAFEGLKKKSSSFRTYDERYNLKKEVYDELYQNLNLFVHTRGQRYLEIEKRKDIVPHYNSKAFDEWHSAYKKTFDVIATSFLVIFPQIFTSRDKCLKDVVNSLPKERLKTITDVSSS